MRRPPAPSPIAVEEALRALGQPGCPVCRYVDDAADRYFTWFAIETSSDPATIATVRAAGGMCPAHTRRLIHQRGAQARLTSLYRDILPTVRTRLATATSSTSGSGGGSGSGSGGSQCCPACLARDEAVDAAWASLRTALADPRVRRRYVAADGLCVAHLRHVLTGREATWATLLAYTAARSLARTETARPAAVAACRIAGTDRDAPARGRWRALLPASGMAGDGDADQVDTLRRLQARLAVNCCPLCLAHGQHERRYLRWLVREFRREPQALATEPGGLCPRHLHDLAVLDPAVAGWAYDKERRYWNGQCHRILAALTALTGREHGGRTSRTARTTAGATASDRAGDRAGDTAANVIGEVAGAAARDRAAHTGPDRLRGWDPAFDQPFGGAGHGLRSLFDSGSQAAAILAEAMRPQGCMVCHAVDDAVTGEASLLVAVLGQHRFAAAYQDAHGLCVRHIDSIRDGVRRESDHAHGRGSAGVAGLTGVAGLVREVAVSRLDLLAAELAEASRKTGWSTRHEDAGPETTAWMRTPAILDGAVFVGGPPRTPTAVDTVQVGSRPTGRQAGDNPTDNPTHEPTDEVTVEPTDGSTDGAAGGGTGRAAADCRRSTSR